jgi:hypothetical protein
VPQIKRLIEAIRDNEHLEKLSLANMGLYDMDLQVPSSISPSFLPTICQPLIDVVEHNTTLRCINLETNYLSGDFFAKLFKAALANQSLEEVKAVNQVFVHLFCVFLFPSKRVSHSRPKPNGKSSMRSPQIEA